MGYFVKINSLNTRRYEAVDKSAFRDCLAFARNLKFKKISFVAPDSCRETFYDTPKHLLNRSGITLSRFQENANVLFKVERTSSQSSVMKKLDKEVFVHKVGANDNLMDHAFYIKDGINALYSSQFSVDLDNIIKNSVPTLEIRLQANIYQVVSGTGMRCSLALEDKFVKNFETNRTYSVQSMTLKLDSNADVYLTEFEEFNALIQKNCKQFLPIEENTFDWATKVTKYIPPKVKEKKKDKKEEKF